MVKKQLNNKGYMLVEIIMAFALAFGLVYFLLDLTIDLKNKNDDLLVTTLVSTDQAIITNLIMEELEANSKDFKCDDIKLNDNVFEFNGKKNIISDYAAVGEVDCDIVDKDNITIKIPIKVKQLPDVNFDVEINYMKSYKVEKAYAVYSADDNSLRFYKTDDLIQVGDTYNGLTATAVYTGIETEEYDYDDIPWIDYRGNITSVVFEDEISPVSTSSWFADFYSCTDFDLTNLDTSDVKNMAWMFYQAGFINTHGTGSGGVGTFILDLSNFDVSSVEYMTGMFEGAARDVTYFKLIGLDDWNVSNVKDMSDLFTYTGFNYAATWDIGDLSNWDVSNVKNMARMFRAAGSFYELGSSAEGTWTVGDISNWDVSNVTDMSDMFRAAGQKATTWNIGNVSSWGTKTSNVTNMSNMFRNAGVFANYSLNLSSWNVDKVTSYTYFNDGVSSKVIAPTWVN